MKATKGENCMCIIRVNPDFLAKLLHLPPGVKVVGMAFDEWHHCLMFKLYGIGEPKKSDGQRLMTIEPQFIDASTYMGTEFLVNWDEAELYDL